MAHFDWRWRTNYSNDSVSSCIRVSDDKVLFHPTYSSGTASVLGDTALSCPEHHYWEVEFTSPVYGTEIMVGLATKKLDLETHLHSFDSLLGLDRNSVGYSYHGYTKHDGLKKRYGDKWGKGDIIGVHIDTWRGNVYFYKNRNFQGLAYKGLKGMEWFPIVTSTAAKSSIKLVTAFSFSNSLQFECFRKLSEKMSRSDLVNVYLPPGLRNFVLNNYWFLGGCSQDWMEPSPERSTKNMKVSLGRGVKNKRNFKEDSSNDGEPLYEDPTLPLGWSRNVTQRKTGATAGGWDTYITASSEYGSKRFRSKQEIRRYFEKIGETRLRWEDFDFNPFGSKGQSVPMVKTKRNYEEDTSTSDSEDDDAECFLNIRSKKLALMRKTRPSMTLQEASPVCTSQDFHYRRRNSQGATKLLEGACCDGHCKEVTEPCHSDVKEEGAGQTTPKLSRKKFQLKIKPKTSD